MLSGLTLQPKSTAAAMTVFGLAGVVAGVSYPDNVSGVAPQGISSSEAPLIDMSHFMGIPATSRQFLLVLAYDVSKSSCLAQTLTEMESKFKAGSSIESLAHNLLGKARTAGANRLAQETKAFRVDPTAEQLKAMWRTLAETRQQLIEDGDLPDMTPDMT